MFICNWKIKLAVVVVLFLFFNVGFVKVVLGADGACYCDYYDKGNDEYNKTPKVLEKLKIISEATEEAKCVNKNFAVEEGLVTHYYAYDSCKWFTPEKFCCCVPTEKGTITQSYKCTLTPGWKGYGKDACKNIANSIPQTPKDGKCEESQLISGTLSNDATTMGISVNQLKLNASVNLNPAGWTDPSNFIGKIIGFFYFAVGATTLIFYIWAGALWMTAGGNAERVDKSKKILIWTTVGVTGVFLSYMITKIIFDYLTK